MGGAKGGIEIFSKDIKFSKYNPEVLGVVCCEHAYICYHLTHVFILAHVHQYIIYAISHEFIYGSLTTICVRHLYKCADLR